MRNVAANFYCLVFSYRIFASLRQICVLFPSWSMSAAAANVQLSRRRAQFSRTCSVREIKVQALHPLPMFSYSIRATCASNKTAACDYGVWRGVLFSGLARTIITRCMHGCFGREITTHTHIYIYGHIRCIHTVLVYPSCVLKLTGASLHYTFELCTKVWYIICTAYYTLKCACTHRMQPCIV